jgi:hypothetical protein
MVSGILAVLSVTMAMFGIVPPVTNGDSIVLFISTPLRATMNKRAYAVREKMTKIRGHAQHTPLFSGFSHFLRESWNIDPHSVCFYNTFMKLSHIEFTGVAPFFGGFFRPDHDPPCVFSILLTYL